MNKTIRAMVLFLFSVSVSAAPNNYVTADKLQAVLECAGLAGEGIGFDFNGENVRTALPLALKLYKRTLTKDMLKSYTSSPDELATNFALFYQQIGVTNAVVLISESLKKKGLDDYGDNHIHEARRLWDTRRCNLIVQD